MKTLAKSICDAGKAVADNLLWIGAGSNAHTERDGSGPAQWLCRSIETSGESIATAIVRAGDTIAAAIRESEKNGK